VPESGVWSPKFSNPGVGVGVPQKNKAFASLLQKQADEQMQNL